MKGNRHRCPRQGGNAVRRPFLSFLGRLSVGSTYPRESCVKEVLSSNRWKPGTMPRALLRHGLVLRRWIPWRPSDHFTTPVTRMGESMLPRAAPRRAAKTSRYVVLCASFVSYHDSIVRPRGPWPKARSVYETRRTRRGPGERETTAWHAARPVGRAIGYRRLGGASSSVSNRRAPPRRLTLDLDCRLACPKRRTASEARRDQGRLLLEWVTRRWDPQEIRVAWTTGPSTRSKAALRRNQQRPPKDQSCIA
jgi:hypothetical protein